MLFAKPPKDILLEESTQSRNNGHLRKDLRISCNSYTILRVAATIQRRILARDLLHKLRQRMKWNVIFDDFLNISLARQAFVILTASIDKENAHHILFTDFFLHLLRFDDVITNTKGVIKEINGVIKLVLLQVNASKIVHATPQLLLVIQIIKDLSHFMVVQECLVVIALVERVSRHFYGLCQVTECEVERVDFVISRLVIEHDVKLFIVSFVAFRLLGVFARK